MADRVAAITAEAEDSVRVAGFDPALRRDLARRVGLLVAHESGAARGRSRLALEAAGWLGVGIALAVLTLTFVL